MDQLSHRVRHPAPQNELDASGGSAAAGQLHGGPPGRLGAVEQREEGEVGGGG